MKSKGAEPPPAWEVQIPARSVSLLDRGVYCLKLQFYHTSVYITAEGYLYYKLEGRKTFSALSGDFIVFGILFLIKRWRSPRPF